MNELILKASSLGRVAEVLQSLCEVVSMRRRFIAGGTHRLTRAENRHKTLPDSWKGWIAKMINGAHVVIYSKDADADRAFFRDVLGFHSVDAGGGWLIFALPPAELGVHPAEAPAHELSFMCDDITATMAELRAKGIEFIGEPEAQGFGVVVTMVLPGDVKVLLYQPRHATAI